MVVATAPSCKQLVLDAGPLLSLSPLRGLAETYVTVPQVFEELKDRRAREHFEQLGLSAGVKVEIESPNALAISKVIEFAKKTGDYSVLSHADICVLALTYALHMKAQQEREKQLSETSQAEGPISVAPAPEADISSQLDSLGIEDPPTPPLEDERNEELPPIENGAQDSDEPAQDNQEQEPLPVELHQISDGAESLADPTEESVQAPNESGAQSSLEAPFEDPSDSDDGEGEWITPSNVAIHKSKYLDHLPSASSSTKKARTQNHVDVGCMTADFAMQNVLLQMGLNLVGVEGKKIDKLKTWVLRCHACFKICKDSSKKFCPSCGNPTLLRTSVTIASPDAGPNTPAMQIHLKKNFQYKLRGTIYPIPAPKAGTAKTGSGEGLILREDQLEYVRATKRADTKRERDEKKLLSNALARGPDGANGRTGNWMDPDWMPEIMSTGASGKGRSMRGAGDLPQIGYGRKNPNERRRKA